MAISRAAYCTREDVQRALDYQETARSDRRVDRAIEAAADAIDGLCHRRFDVADDTRSWDWPNGQYAVPWRLWLDSDEIISVTSLVAGGVTVAPGDYLLRRSDGRDAAPYDHIEINLAGPASFAAGDTFQQAIVVTGTWGYRATTSAVGTLVAAVSSASATTVDVSSGADVGVGDTLLVDAERMLVTGRRQLDTGQTITADLGATNAAVSVTVSDGSAFTEDEVILVDSERMLVVDIAGNTLTVKRAWDGSVLAAHTTSTAVWAARRLKVTRGALGTTPATHSQAAAVARYAPPGLVRDLAVAEAVVQLLGEQAGYASKGGVSDNARSNTVTTSNIRSYKDERGVGLSSKRNQVYERFGRKARVRAV